MKVLPPPGPLRAHLPLFEGQELELGPKIQEFRLSNGPKNKF
jgi:hypothetical protein